MSATARGSHSYREPAPGEAWEEQAACVRHPDLVPEDWTCDEGDPRHEQRHAAAKAVCFTECPVRTDCLEWARRTGQAFGVLGGLTDRERNTEVRREARALAAAS